MTKFITFHAANTEGGLSTVVMAVDKIVAIERTLAKGAVLITGAAFSVSASEATRIAKLVTELN